MWLKLRILSRSPVSRRHHGTILARVTRAATRSACSRCCNTGQSRIIESSGHLAGYTPDRDMCAHAVGVGHNECPVCEITLGTLDNDELCSLVHWYRLR